MCTYLPCFRAAGNSGSYACDLTLLLLLSGSQWCATTSLGFSLRPGVRCQHLYFIISFVFYSLGDVARQITPLLHLQTALVVSSITCNLLVKTPGDCYSVFNKQHMRTLQQRGTGQKVYLRWEQGVFLVFFWPSLFS